MRLALSVLAGVLAAALPWALRLWRAWRWGLPVRITVDPDNPSADALADYFATVARRLDERPERMRLVIDGRTAARRALTLDFLPDGAMSACVEGEEPKLFSLRRRWIPDHPVPLDLRACHLWIEPVDANRFRVMDSVPFSVPGAVYALCALVATAGVVCFSPECLALAIGLAVGCITSGGKQMA
jgi:hypothetical protein